MFRFAQLWYLYILLPIVALLLFYHVYGRRKTRYQFSLVSWLLSVGYGQSNWRRWFLLALNTVILCSLALLIAKPQWVDPTTKTKILGIDIMLVLDASGSMQFSDFEDDARSRFDIAKDEAIQFIKKRTDDAIGLTMFGNVVISRVPLTVDKAILQDIIQKLELGAIDPSGTLLSTAIIAAANRLKTSKAKSKVMIVLTDGSPSQGDLNPQAAVDIAKQLGIRIYTIGIGSEKGRIWIDPMRGMVQQGAVNKELLTAIAKRTGGKFFMARNAKSMREIYNTIDSLEKTEQEVPLFTKWVDRYIPYVWILVALVLINLVLKTIVWFGL